MAKGCPQEEGIDYDDVFSPMVKHSSIRISFVLLDLEQVQLDVKTTFLNGHEKKEIHMNNKPDGCKVVQKANWACKLRNSLYGLSNSNPTKNGN